MELEAITLHPGCNNNINNIISTLAELCLYQGTGYFPALCSRIESFYNDKVNFAFSSAFSLKPNPQVVSNDEYNSESDKEKDKE